MKVRILGCGASIGVPVIGCICDVCDRLAPLNMRTRTSAMIEINKRNILIDASLDFRAQMLRWGYRKIDGVVYTHLHFDHTGGTPDLAPIAVNNGEPVPVYSDARTMDGLKNCFKYMFDVSKPSLIGHVFDYRREFYVQDLRIFSFKQVHGRYFSNGFIFNDEFAYCTDVSELPEDMFDILKDIKLLVLGCLRFEPALAHANFDLCMQWIERINPRLTILTHMSHAIDYDYITERLKDFPRCIVPGYDGLYMEKLHNEFSVIS